MTEGADGGGASGDDPIPAGPGAGGGEPSGGGDDSGGGRDLWQVLAALAVLAALLTAAALVTAMDGPTAPSAGGPNATPTPSDPPTVTPPGGDGPRNPGQQPGGRPGSQPGGAIGGGSVQPGALNPGRRTGIGGRIRPGEGGLSNAVHFVVETDRPTYWRTGAYGRYTGESWNRISDPEIYTGPLPTDGGQRYTQEVSLRRPATALPSGWKPERIGFEERVRAEVYVTRRTAFATAGRVPAGTNYTVTSYARDPAPGELAAAGTDYPRSVERYTELPTSTPGRVHEFTDNLTSEAENPYETARTIEAWLEANKEYALNVSHRQGEPIADQFVFEMEAGYCEYFATSMVVMLRSQGVPARYVVGYAPGTQVGNDTYEVRGMDAHAWVEVYFPDVGWVRFDPTPAASRRAVERGTLPDDGGSGSDRRPIVPGSPGERPGGGGLPPSINGTDPGEWPDDVPGQVPGKVQPPPYDIEVSPDPVPGRRVTVTVTKDGKPVQGVIVLFNGDPVGITNRNGEVKTTVPYEDSLEVDAVPPEGATTTDDDIGVAAGLGAGVRGLDPPPSVRWGLGPPSASRSAGGDATVRGGGPLAADQFGDDDNETARRYDLNTAVSFSVEGPRAPGRTVVVTATIDGVPVRGATVRAGGRRVGRTDSDGKIQVSIPRSERDEVPVAVERGEVQGQFGMPVRGLSVRVDPDSLVALPGVGATVVVTADGHPVEGATVTMDGERVGTTGENGRVRVGLPVASSARLHADGPVLSSTTHVRRMFAKLGVVAALLLVGVGAGVRAVRRREDSVRAGTRSFGEWVARALRRLVDGAVRAAILAGGALHGLVGWTRAAAGGLLGSLAGLAGRVRERIAAVTLSGVTALLEDGVRGAWEWFVGGMLSALAAVRRLVARLLPWVDAETAQGGEEPSPDAGADAGDYRRISVRAALRTLIALVGLGGWRTLTPGEIEREAVDSGLPEKPVRAITDAFRDVEYGGREESDDLRDRVSAALDRIRTDGGQSANGSGEAGPAARGGDD